MTIEKFTDTHLADGLSLQELIKDETFMEEFDCFKDSMKDFDRDMLLFLAFRSIGESVGLHNEESSIFEENFSQAFDLIKSLKDEIASLKKDLKKMKNTMKQKV